MTQAIDNEDPRVIQGIRCAVDMASKGETDSAVQYLSTLIEQFPAAASLHGYVALFLSDVGRFNEAIEHGQQAIRLSHESEKASLVLFQALCKADHYIEALDEMKRFLAVGASKEYTEMIREWNLSEDD